MLRAAAILLLLANLAYFAWTQGSLEGIGLAPTDEREPERLTAQIQPETLRLLNGARNNTAPVGPTAATGEPPSEAPPAAAAAPQVGCWQATGFTSAQATDLGVALGGLGLTDSEWRFTEVRTPGRWVVYMGRYNDEQMAKKKGELRELKIEFREVSLPGIGPGLALGTFASEEAVQQALKDVGRKGVRSARIAVERPETLSLSLRLPAITEAQLAAVQGLGSALAGKTLQGCN